MYTTGIIALYEEHKIALFLNGRQHSGENVGDILALRDPEKEPIIQMCDALSANIPKTLQHNLRLFVILDGNAPL
jgi:transposase